MLHRRAALCLLAAPALAQTWPGSQPVSIIIPYAPGGASDVAR